MSIDDEVDKSNVDKQKQKKKPPPPKIDPKLIDRENKKVPNQPKEPRESGKKNKEK